MIGYLHGSTIRSLLAAGVTQAWYGTSETPAHRGDLTSVYFFDEGGTELAHQTQLAGLFDNPEVAVLKRNWGGQLSDRGYERSFRWNSFLDRPEEILDGYIYRVI
jgi:hypothetical protein